METETGKPESDSAGSISLASNCLETSIFSEMTNTPNLTGSGVPKQEVSVDVTAKLPTTTTTVTPSAATAAMTPSTVNIVPQTTTSTFATSIAPLPSTPSTATSVPNSLSKLLNTPGAPSVVRPQPHPQARPQTNGFLANIAARTSVDYSLYRNNNTFPNLMNGNLTQFQTIPNNFNPYSSFQPQLVNNQTTLLGQNRPGRPTMVCLDTTNYSVSPTTQPLPYRPQARPQYPTQNPNSSPKGRPRVATAQPGYVSSHTGTSAAAPARAATTNEKVFPLLYSQLSTTNQILLGEYLTKLKNKAITWDEFFKRTLEIFGNKHRAFFQAIGCEYPKIATTGTTGTTAQTVAAPKPVPVPAPVIAATPVSTSAATPVTSASKVTGPAAPSTGTRAPIWNPGLNQGNPGNVTNSLPTMGIARPQIQTTTVRPSPQVPVTTTSLSSVRPPVPNESRSNGEDSKAVDFDNLTDVMGSVGVDLREESENIMRSVHGSVGLRANSSLTEDSGSRTLDHFAPPPFVEASNLDWILSRITSKYSISEVSPEVLELLSLAVEERVRSLLEQIIKTSKHRALAQQSYPTPPLNDNGKPIYKVMVNKDPRKQIQALERADKDRVRKYYLRLQEGSHLDDEGEPRSKKSKNKRDGFSGLTATASARNMSEESRKANANQTTHMFTGGLRKSWMLASTTPRVSSPLASTPPTKPSDSKSDKPKDSKNFERSDSALASVKKHAPAVSSNLVIKTSSSPSSPATNPLVLKKDQSSLLNPSSNSTSLSFNRPKSTVSPLTSSLSSRFAKYRPTTRSLTAQDALFVIESDVSGRPCSSRAKVLMRTYATLK